MENDGGLVFLGDSPEHLYTATDAEIQNQIILHDNTLNLHVVARKPHPDPSSVPHTAVRLLAVA